MICETKVDVHLWGSEELKLKLVIYINTTLTCCDSDSWCIDQHDNWKQAKHWFFTVSGQAQTEMKLTPNVCVEFRLQCYQVIKSIKGAYVDENLRKQVRPSDFRFEWLLRLVSFCYTILPGITQFGGIKCCSKWIRSVAITQSWPHNAIIFLCLFWIFTQCWF